MIVLKHLKRSDMFRSIIRSSSGSSYSSLLKSLIKTMKGLFFGDATANRMMCVLDVHFNSFIQ
jgi:hypothetical protein